MNSLEVHHIGKYNRNHNPYLPAIQRIASAGTIFTNLTHQPYATSPFASFFASHCGLPLLTSDDSDNLTTDSRFLAESSKTVCVSDFLKQAGFEVFSVLIGRDRKLRDFLTSHNHHVFDESVHYQTSEQDMFRWMEKHLVNELLNRWAVRPFVLCVHISSCIKPYEVECRARLPVDFPRFFRSMDCVDQAIFSFLGKMPCKYDVVLHGGSLERREFSLYKEEDRRIPMILSRGKKSEFVRSGSLYDVGPTILDFAGVKYSPEFPFGASLFGDVRMEPPGVGDFEEVWNELKQEFGSKMPENVMCNGVPGFCASVQDFRRKSNLSAAKPCKLL
jgi:hypothetical protein